MVLVLTLALVLYTYVGYPVLVALLARVAPVEGPRGTRSSASDAPAASSADASSAKPKVSICIPVYNGAALLPAKIATLAALTYPKDKLETVFYLDGCTDDSEAILRAAEGDLAELVIVRGTDRVGKPTALNAMAAAASGEILVMMDVRQRVDPDVVEHLVRGLTDDAVGVVSGNLVIDTARGAGVYWLYEKWIRQSEGAFRSLVGATGALYALRARDMPRVPKDVILDDVFVPMTLRLAGLRTAFAAEARAYDSSFEDDREFGRKVRTLAGNFQLMRLLPRLCVPFANPSFFEWMSHKVMRLVCPWLLLVVAEESVRLGFFFRCRCDGDEIILFARVLVAGEALFALLALLGPLGGRFGRVARSFVVMNAAAVVGFFRYVTGSQKITW